MSLHPLDLKVYLDYARSQDKFMNQMQDFFESQLEKQKLKADQSTEIHQDLMKWLQWRLMEDFQDNHPYYLCGWDGFVIMVVFS